MFRFVKQLFIGLVSFDVLLAAYFSKNQPCITRPTPFGLNLVELRYNQFVVSLPNCEKVCNTLSSLFDRLCILNKTEDASLKVFNLIPGLKEL